MDVSTREEQARSVSERVLAGGAARSQSRAVIHGGGFWSPAIRAAIYSPGREPRPQHTAILD